MDERRAPLSGPVTRRTLLKAAAAGALVARAGLPAAAGAADDDVVRIGHLTPLTGFLAQIGEYSVMAVKLAVEEANASGGVLGKKVELVSEDSVNPATAATKAQKMVERDRVHALLGEISSASAGAIAEVARRAKVVYVNTGANSDELRGAKCNRYMFHVEGCNTMYTKTIGHWQQANNLLKGARWYFLTADYAFGHDLYRVSSRFVKENGGIILGNDMVPTNSLDYSAYILKIRQANPDFVYINLAGVDQTTFLKQYREYGLSYRLAGGVMDTVPFWAAGRDALTGYWQSLWFHGLANRDAAGFTGRFVKRYGKPPDNQAWGDYVASRILFQTMSETKSLRSDDLVRYLESGAKFDILKDRPGTFRGWDHQLLQEMYVVRIKDESNARDKWDIFELVETVPGKGDSLEAIQPTREENPCTFAS